MRPASSRPRPTRWCSSTSDVAEATDVETLINDAMAFLKENGVTVDPASQYSKDGEVAGLPATMIGFQGKDEAGEAIIQLGVIKTAADKRSLTCHGKHPARLPANDGAQHGCEVGTEVVTSNKRRSKTTQ